ncbi:unnamed protein product [Camellia sinensis]
MEVEKEMEVIPDPNSNSTWAWLPQNLVDNILDKMVSLQDYIRFGGVSPNWRRITQENHHKRIEVKNNLQLPLLMIPTSNNSRMRRGLYSLTKPGICETELPVPYRRRCCGSSHGWLITLDVRTAVIGLINPFSSRMKLLFPSFMGDIIIIDDDTNSDRFSEYYIHKAVLSADPDSSNYDIAIIYGSGRKLAVLQITTTVNANANATSNAKEWRFINGKPYRSFQDIIYHKDRFYAMDVWGQVYSCDVRGPSTIMHDESVAPTICVFLHPHSKKYLVESPKGDLWHVIRLIDPAEGGNYWTTKFRVYRLVERDHISSSRNRDRLKWVEMDRIGDCALFLGDNHSLSVVASDFPRGCMPNCIYYTDDGTAAFMAGTSYDATGAYDIGVYNMVDKTISQHYVPNLAHMFLPPPIWIVPTLK